MWPDDRVVRLVRDHFEPVRVHARQHAEAFQRLGDRYDAHWTPTVLILDSKGEEHHRMEGFLPLPDFVAQLDLGLAHTAFAQGRYEEAERRFREVRDRDGVEDAAAEAQYWTGVSRYRATQDAGALTETAREFERRFAGSSWAKKASVWRQ